MLTKLKSKSSQCKIINPNDIWWIAIVAVFSTLGNHLCQNKTKKTKFRADKL